MNFDRKFLKKQYEIKSDCPKAIEWDEYENILKKEYYKLMKSKMDDESAFQDFFERNPCMLPGAFGVLGESGHAPFNNVLITQPRLTGLTTKIPDFMWIAYDSCTVYPTFIEIEKPSKKWYTSTGVPSSDFIQAQNQLTDWQDWFANPVHQQLFFQSYNINTESFTKKNVTPYYILIYGSRNEFIDEKKKCLNRKRSLLTRENEVYMTFDRLTPNIKARDIITCIVRNQEYYAKYVQPVFRVGPVFAKEMSGIHNKDEAIEKNNLISDERKQFLLSRLPYWDEYGKTQIYGIKNTNDWE